jgi:phosphohistidine phosphatase SixA
MVGHNPVLEELLVSLVGESHRMPTAALAVVELPIAGWRQILQAPRGRLRHLWLPRELAKD